MGFKIRTLDGKKLKHHEVKFLYRINNDGKKLNKVKTSPDYFLNDRKLKVFCLSMTHKKWIATDGCCTWVVEITDTKKNVRIPDFSELKKG